MRLFTRRRMWHRLVVVGLLLAGTFLAAPCAAQPVPEVRDTLARLEVLLEGLAADAPGVATPRDRALAVVRLLRELSRTWPAQSPEAYRRSLVTLDRVLEGAAARADQSALPGVLTALTEDLETKLEHCLASGGKLGGTIRVQVRTRDGRQEARDWQVLYLPKILEASSAAANVFPRLSSPTDDVLVPGRYVVWARNPFTGQSGQRLVVKVGGGRSDLEIDLPVPVQSP